MAGRLGGRTAADLFVLSDGAGNTATVVSNNTIVADSNTGVDFVATTNDGGTAPSITGGNNLVESNSGVPGGVISVTDDPKLGPLQDNGGPTPTMAITSDSVAFDAGDNTFAAGLAFDQRGTGFPHIADQVVDIGAFEVPNQPPTDVALSPSSVRENVPAGTTVGTLSTTDLDNADTFTYEFAGGPDDTSFQIVGDQLQTAAGLNFEAKSSYQVKVRSTDSGGLAVVKDITITIIDVNEAPTVTVPAAQTAFEDVNLRLPGITVADVDDGSLVIALAVSQGTLRLRSTAGLSVSGDRTSAVTLSGSIADLNAALAGLVYRGRRNFGGADTLNVTVWDGTLTPAAACRSPSNRQCGKQWPCRRGWMPCRRAACWARAWPKS